MLLRPSRKRGLTRGAGARYVGTETKATDAMSDLIARIDAALGSNPAVRSGYSAYAALIATYDKAAPANVGQARDDLIEGMVSLAADTYAAEVGGAELFTFSDGANQCLFDCKHERTVLMWGVSRTVPANSRDDAYHGGYPRAGDGYDKGHALSHAQGGLEGGPNYFKQRVLVNRRLSATGHLWRDIETFLAANAGLLAFVRLIYANGDTGEKPVNVEYDVLAGPGQFRSVIFPN